MSKTSPALEHYKQCKPKQFGDMHQRMKFLIEAMQEAGSENVPNDVWHAAYDLETEVKNHVAKRPPFGRR